MVESVFSKNFRKKFEKIKDNALKEKIIKQILKLKENPEFGKPMMYARKGTRELYVSPYRISYFYNSGKIVFLDVYHKDGQ
ncbi:MAG: type II toxin-antitoxin system RelE/ParE family toxin [Candidatus Woesearchaeota archaeon]